MIGTLRETALHAALKARLAQSGDGLEVPVDGFIADIVRDGVIIEVQVRGFSALRRKLPRLLDSHAVRLVHPIVAERSIVYVDGAGRPLKRRRSPWRGGLAHLFLELVSIPDLVAHPRFTLDVVLVREEAVRGPAAVGRRRHRRGVGERRLVEIVQQTTFASPGDYARFLPAGLPQPFSCRELAGALGQPLYLAQKIAYCLRRMGLLADAGTRGRARLYSAAAGQPAGEKEPS